MNDATPPGARANQKLRTRKDLLEAAARLMREGKTPTFEEIAEAALVSRATAYRYFPGLEALMLEAALDIAVPSPEELFGTDASDDPVERLDRLDAALAGVIAANEPGLRVLLAQTIQHATEDAEAPVRQNRRGPLVEAALAPVQDQFRHSKVDQLSAALVLLFGIEAQVVFKDVLQLSDADAAKVRRFVIRALVKAARKA